jgi:hypothetical protein
MGSVICNSKKSKYNEYVFIDKIKEYYNIFKNNTNIIPFNSTNLTYVLSSMYESIYDEITNNIKYNYEKMIMLFVGTYFPKKDDIKKKVR